MYANSGNIAISTECKSHRRKRRYDRMYLVHLYI